MEWSAQITLGDQQSHRNGEAVVRRTWITTACNLKVHIIYRTLGEHSLTPLSSYPQSTLVTPERVNLTIIYDLVSDPHHSALMRLPGLRVPPHRIVASSRPIRKINSH